MHGCLMLDVEGTRLGEASCKRACQLELLLVEEVFLLAYLGGTVTYGGQQNACIISSNLLM